MKKLSANRRVPRRIGADDEDDNNKTPPASTAGETASEPALVRPSTIKSRKAVAPVRKTAFPADRSDDEEKSATSTGVVAPKRSKLSKIAIQRTASNRSTLLGASLPLRRNSEEEDEGGRQADDGPSYSAAALQQLKDSTPATPRDLLPTSASASDVDDVANDTRALDISSKFGGAAALARYQQQSSSSSAIPSATEIAEKKARRARLAKEHAAEEFISLDVSDPDLDDLDADVVDRHILRNERARLTLKPKDKYGEAESRLTHDDEDIMENFDEFTEADGKLALSRHAEAEAKRRRRVDMAAQIAEAEGATSAAAGDSDGMNDDSDDASERERNEAFEAAQTRHGTSGAGAGHRGDAQADGRPTTPQRISPLPTLDGVIERLRKQVAALQTSRMQTLQEMETLQREKIRLGEEEIRVQRALRETAEKFRALREEKGIAEKGDVSGGMQGSSSALVGVEAGGAGLAGEESDHELDDDDGGGRGGLGLGMAPRRLQEFGIGHNNAGDGVLETHETQMMDV